MKKDMSWIKKETVFTIISIMLMILIVEVFATIAVYHKYKESNTALRGTSFSSTYLIIRKALVRIGIVEEYKYDHERVTSSPQPLYVPNELQGYVNKPGEYKVRMYDIFNKDSFHQAKVTIQKNRTRFVGKSNENTSSNIFVFGDSCVFGEGLNDEQTFTYLLQQKFRHSKFHLYATGGHSLSNALINIRKLKDVIGSDDLIILGYAEFYKRRHVAAPSRMREYKKPTSMVPKGLGHLRFWLNENNELAHEVIPLFCEDMVRYCRGSDPSSEIMNKVTIEIINEIASTVKAKVLLLHFMGSTNDPVLSSLDQRIEIISATTDTFPYKIRDRIMEFDNHPGPFWHYAIFTRISERLNALVENKTN